MNGEILKYLIIAVLVFWFLAEFVLGFLERRRRNSGALEAEIYKEIEQIAMDELAMDGLGQSESDVVALTEANIRRALRSAYMKGVNS